MGIGIDSTQLWEMETGSYALWKRQISGTGTGDFSESVRNREASATDPAAEGQTEQEAWERRLEQWDQEMERIREDNKRYQEWLEERRICQKRKQELRRKKELLLEQLNHRDEITQELQRAAMKRALGEDLYIEKAPLTKSLSASELLELCGE